MPDNKQTQNTKLVVATEDRGLQPAKNPSPMPQVKPPAQEKKN